MVDVEKTNAPVMAYSTDDKLGLDEKDMTTHVEVVDGKGVTEWDMIRADAIKAEDAQRSLGLIGSLKAYPTAAFWSFAISLLISESDRPCKANVQSWRATTRPCSATSWV